MIAYTTRPLSDRSWLREPAARTTPQFRVAWTAALDLLEREVDQLRGRDVVIEIDVAEADLRLDGRLRAHARPGSSAVVVAFDAADGPLLFRSDRYLDAPHYRTTGMQHGWQHNVYAVALTLEALRAVDRYGITRHAEQYAGWRQITAGPAIVPDPPLGRREAAVIVAKAANPGISATGLRAMVEALVRNDAVDGEFRRALRYTHPDHGGSADDFALVQRAIAVLRGDV